MWTRSCRVQQIRKMRAFLASLVPRQSMLQRAAHALRPISRLAHSLLLLPRASLKGAFVTAAAAGAARAHGPHRPHTPAVNPRNTAARAAQTDGRLIAADADAGAIRRLALLNAAATTAGRRLRVGAANCRSFSAAVRNSGRCAVSLRRRGHVDAAAGELGCSTLTAFVRRHL